MLYQCVSCTYETLKRRDYANHLQTEKHKIIQALKAENDALKVEVQNKDSVIETLKTIIKDLSNKPSVSNSNSNNNNTTIHNRFVFQPILLSKVKFEDIVSIPLLVQGPTAFHENLYNILFVDESGNPKAVCTDYARKIVKWQQENGSIVTDAKLSQFIKFFRSEFAAPLRSLSKDIFQYEEENEVSENWAQTSLNTARLFKLCAFLVEKTYYRKI